MSFFCLLWVPLFFLLRRSLVGGGNSSGSVWALILGSLTAILQFLLGYIVSPGGFGFSRWLFGFVDIVSLPVIIPLLACLVMLIFRSLSGDVDFVKVLACDQAAVREQTGSADCVHFGHKVCGFAKIYHKRNVVISYINRDVIRLAKPVC